MIDKKEVAKIVQVVINHFPEATIESVYSSNRCYESAAIPRNIIMYILYSCTGHTLKEIAKEFNKADHTATINARNSIKQRINTDIEFKKLIGSIMTTYINS